MNEKLWQQAELIRDAALQLPAEKYADYIDAQTGDNHELKKLVSKMISAESDESFMRAPPRVEVNELMTAADEHKFGHFIILRKIAVGGMGRIFQAQLSNSEVPVFVALKLIRKELINVQMSQRFDNEKQILGKLKHHNIAALIDAGMVGENPYIATEWVDGEAINDYVNAQNLGVDKVLKLFLQVCAAVSYAHNQMVIHRDLKPANILIDKNHQVKLLDFGIAKLIDANNSQMTQTQVFTPDYAAPEQINGEVCTAVTDIYALGVLLFELLVGKKRFGLEDMSIAEKISAISKPKTIFASQVMQHHGLSRAPKVKGALDTIINQAMHPDPARRYQSVYELISDIKRYQQHRPIKALGDSWVYRSQMFIRRHAWSCLMGSLLFLSLLFGLIYSNQQKEQAQQAERLAQIESEKTQQMLNFFMTVLETASPLSGGSTQISVQQMFEDGADKFNLDEITDAVIKAEIAGQVAEIYGELSENDLKIKYNQIALNFYQSDLTQYASKFLYHHLNIAHAYRDQDQYDLALAQLSTAYEQVKNHQVDASLLAELMINFGEFYYQFDEVDKALSYLNQATEMARAIEDVESLGKVKYYQYLILQYELPPKESELYLLQAQTYFEQAYLNSHPDLLSVRNSLGIKYKDEGQYQKASDLYELIHDEYQQLYGSKNHDHLTNHANVMFALGDFELAAELTRESLLLIDEKSVGEGFSSMAASVVLARSLTELGQYNEAEKLWLQALKYFDSRFSNEHAVMLSLRTYWLDFLIKAGRLNENVDDVNALIGLAESQLNESFGTKQKYVNTLITVATYHWVQDNYQAALNHLITAQQVLQEVTHKQEWSYWFIEAGIDKLNELLDIASDPDPSTDSLAQLFMLIPQDHWYHNLFDPQ